LREAVAARENRLYGAKLTEKDILITIGAKEGIYLAIQSYLNPGEEVLVPDPGWVSYTQIAKSAEGKAIPYNAGMVPDLAEIENKLTSRTKLIIINTPHNPAGVVYPKKFLEELGGLAQKKGIIVMSDEPYDKMIYEGTHYSIGAMFPENTITLNSTSKTYAMTGWRVGYAATKVPFSIEKMLNLQTHIISGVTTFAQHGAVTAYTGPQDCVREMVAAYKKRRDLLAAGLDKKYFKFNIPQGTYYMFVDVSATGAKDGTEFATKLVEKNVAAVPGEFFGENCRQFVRFTFSQKEEDIKTAIGRINDLANEMASGK
jgi:aspartate aminotransferase